MKRFTASGLVLALVATASASVALAQDYRGGPRGPADVRRDQAQVIRVERLVDPYASYQRQECWNDRTRRHDAGYYRDGSGRLYRRDDDGTEGAVIGAVVGGALGNQVGKGDGRKAATVAGALIGAAIGRDVDRNDGYYRYNDNRGSVVRCRNITVRDDDRYWRYNGFHVTYRYAGQTYQTVTRRHPGRSLRVLVEVRPDEN